MGITYLVAYLVVFHEVFMQVVRSDSKLARLILENENLLNKMHEGIIVVSQ